ncbi:oligosaccharide flippase family protein [Silicimonas algicola]|uniref:O-antigen/teichoic acid export membrane protein n=1 Tax=Silicimonas algicola TaxID=1826607 RepID=A0A316GBC2_9RHOB|nr:oligosaccharide flippase family protein [Silicimonas algicola]PWK58211.1 O-antigen/teichoic acid export membrane protein [Silicimonas algicola]
MARGLSITLSSYVFSRLINFLTTVGLARLLSPADMGLVATALLIVYFVDVARDFGLRDAIVFEPTGTAETLATAFYLVLGLSAIQATATLAVSGVLAGGFDRHQLGELLAVMAFFFPVQAAGAIHESILLRLMRFNEVAVAEILGVTSKALVTFLTVFLGFGPTSFAIGHLTGSVIRSTFILWRPDMPKFVGAPFSRDRARSLLGYGVNIFVTGLVFVLRMRSDQAAIAVWVGEIALAGYFLASRLPEIMISGINGAITRVVFPSFIEAGRYESGLQRIFLSTIHGCMALIAPISIGISVVASDLVPLVFGESYEYAAPALVFLALIGIPQTLGWTIGDLLKATGRPRTLMIVNIVEAAIIVPVLWTVAAIFKDLTAIAIALFVCECLAGIARVVVTHAIGVASITQVVAAVLRPATFALLMGAGVLFVQGLADVSRVASLALATTVGIAMYAALMVLFDAEAVRKVRDFLRKAN